MIQLVGITLQKTGDMTNFFDVTLKELEDIVESMGLKRFRARQVYKWVYQMDTADFDLMTNLPKGFRITLKKMFHFGLPEVRETVRSGDQSVKFGFRTSDGHVIESVFMPENGRSTLCLSTQVGCKMSCAFCVTGKIGFVRDLTTAEIVGQVMAMKPFMGEAKLSNIVFMGMGEPVDNIDNVLKYGVGAVNVDDGQIRVQGGQSAIDFSGERTGYGPGRAVLECVGSNHDLLRDE